MQFHTNPQQQFKRKRFIRNWRIGRALKRVYAIQVLREEFVPQVAKYGAKVAVIGNWSRYEGDKPATSAEKLIIYPAAFGGKKNHALLIEAFMIARKHYPDWSLELYGGGKAPDHLPEGVKAMGYCDLRAAYRRCAFLAFPSLDEGFGLVIADAAMFGKPCIMVKDWIGTCADGGGVLVSNNPQKFALELERLMDNSELANNMGRMARRFCLKNYSRSEILDKWEELCRQ